MQVKTHHFIVIGSLENDRVATRGINTVSISVASLFLRFGMLLSSKPFFRFERDQRPALTRSENTGVIKLGYSSQAGSLAHLQALHAVARYDCHS